MSQLVGTVTGHRSILFGLKGPAGPGSILPVNTADTFAPSVGLPPPGAPVQFITGFIPPAGSAPAAAPATSEDTAGSMTAASEEPAVEGSVEEPAATPTEPETEPEPEPEETPAEDPPAEEPAAG